MGFGADAIAIVSGGLRDSTGGFAERLVSWGYVGAIAGIGAGLGVGRWVPFEWWDGSVFGQWSNWLIQLARQTLP